VILFVKFPEKGKVKSRLARHLDGDVVLMLYECMVMDAIDMLRNGHFPFRICFDPPAEHERMERWLGQQYRYMPQLGDNLGERMEKAFSCIFSEKIDEAVLVGSDIPGMTSAILDEAFLSLMNHDCVIGPASDGGYYLIGFRKSAFYPPIFYDMPWSTSGVFHETVLRLGLASLSVHVLPECSDLDTRADLVKLLVERCDKNAPVSRTQQYLNSIRSSIID
jgi:uncharacterized protein